MVVRVIKELDDKGEVVPFTNEHELEHAMLLFANQVDTAEWWERDVTYWTVIVEHGGEKT